MLATLRTHTSLLVAVSAIVVLAASQATAEVGPTKPGMDPPTSGTAGTNADTVDGRHAVGSGLSPAQRAGQLVATNAAGYLPNDIVRKAADADRLDGLDSAAFARSALLRSSSGAVNQADNPVHWNQLKGVPADLADGRLAWGELRRKPATLADGAIAWAEVQDMPAGFADGVDNAGVTKVTLTTVATNFSIGVAHTETGVAICPAGSRVSGGGFDPDTDMDVNVHSSRPFGGDTWIVTASNLVAAPQTVTVYALCLGTQPASAIATATQTR